MSYLEVQITFHAFLPAAALASVAALRARRTVCDRAACAGGACEAAQVPCVTRTREIGTNVFGMRNLRYLPTHERGRD